jgi:hypothetical protein
MPRIVKLIKLIAFGVDFRKIVPSNPNKYPSVGG